jgi:peptidoglycan/LPS O-acetylase OafA/YrhL
MAWIGPVGDDVLGRAGVIFFFVHTCLVLLKSLDRTPLTGWGLAANFYVRRIFRIYPLSIFVVLAMVAFHVPAMPTESYLRVSTPTLLANLALVQNLTKAPDILGPLWSLPWEVQMYAAIPIVFWALRARTSGAAWRLWLVVLLVRMLGLIFHIKVLSLLAYAPCFLVGAIIWRSSRQQQKFDGRWFPLAILAAGATYIVLREADGYQSLFVAAYAASLILGIALPLFRDFPPSLLTKFCHYVAKYSYGIYLSHVPLMWIVRVLLAGVNPVLRFTFLAATSVAVPVLLFHLLEDPLIRVGKRLAGAIDPSNVPAISA